MVQLLVERGADLEVRVKLPGHYERPDAVVECTPLGYARRFQDESYSEGRTIAFLRARGRSNKSVPQCAFEAFHAAKTRLPLDRFTCRRCRAARCGVDCPRQIGVAVGPGV